jgi:glycine oxidase
VVTIASEQANEMPTSKNSAAETSYEVVVVGAGVIGLAIGWRAATRGLRTVVLDAEAPARGATHVAAGMLAPVNEATFGEEQLLRLNLEAARLYPQFVRELEQLTGIDTGYAACGTLSVALDRDDVELLRRLHEFQLSLGLESEWLGARECRRLEPALAPRIAGGIRTGIDHQVDPRPLSHALAAALEKSGGALRPHAPVAALLGDGTVVDGVELESGERIEAEHVVVAAGWRSGDLAGVPAGATVPVRPVKGQILRLRALSGPPLARRVIGTPDVYVVPRANGEVVVGATVEDRGADSSVTAGGVLELLRRAYDVLPGIEELELVEASAGLRPASPDNAPIIGPSTLPGLIWATAHWRNGILLAPITAAAVVDPLSGGGPPDEVAPYSPARFATRAAQEVSR